MMMGRMSGCYVLVTGQAPLPQTLNPLLYGQFSKLGSLLGSSLSGCRTIWGTKKGTLFLENCLYSTRIETLSKPYRNLVDPFQGYLGKQAGPPS